MGRMDHQVKIRGLRIELVEIESILVSHQDVMAGVVIVREDSPGDKRLVGYVVMMEGKELDGHGLRVYLAQKLPEYMIPGVFVEMKSLPLSPNGKVDRNALPMPPKYERGEGMVAAPMSPTEQLVADLFGSVLQVDRVGRHDDFFALGGDSIVSIQVIARAVKVGFNFSVKQLFMNTTPALLAPLLVKQTTSFADEDEMNRVKVGPVPLTPIQHYLFDGDGDSDGDRGRHHFNMAMMLEVEESVKFSYFEQAVAVVHRQQQEVFGLRYHPRVMHDDDDGHHKTLKVDQVLHDDSPLFSLQRMVVSGGSLECCDDQIKTMVIEVQKSFDLERGPLSKLVWVDIDIIKINDDDNDDNDNDVIGCKSSNDEQQLQQQQKMVMLLWVIHHLVVDGVSWRILLGEVKHAYEQLASGQKPGLMPMPYSFPRWAIRLQEFGQSDYLQKQRDYWLQVLSTTSSIPMDDQIEGEGEGEGEGRFNNRHPYHDDASRVLKSVWDEDRTERLLHVPAAAFGVHPGEVILTALGRVLGSSSSYYREEGEEVGLRIDIESHGRDAELDGTSLVVDLSQAVGWFTSLFPMVLPLQQQQQQQQQSMLEGLKRVKETLRGTPNHGIGFGVLRYLNRDVDILTALKRHGEAKICFNYLGQT